METTEPAAPATETEEPAVTADPEIQAGEEAEPAAEVPETVTLPKAEADALRREVAESRRRAKRAAEEAEQAKRKQLEEQGKFKELAEAADLRAKEAEERFQRLERNARIRDAAGRLRFRNEADAVALLPPDAVDGDDATLEAALAALAKERPYLIDSGTPPRTGAPAGDPPAQTGRKVTRDQLKTMSPQDIAKLPHDEVAAALHGS